MEIPWSLEASSTSRRAERALEQALQCAQDFDTAFDLHNPEREEAVPQFDPSDLILSDEPLRFAGLQAEYELREISVDVDGSFGISEKKQHFAARSVEGFFSVKFLQEGIVDQEHAEDACTEMIRETKILMSLAPHPHISTIYGITSKRADSLLVSGRNGYFFITDRVSETLEDRLHGWRRNGPDGGPSITERLDTALDIASALVYLHDRKLVYYVRPDKIAFDARHGRVKLCSFGQARQHGMKSHPRSVTQSDNIRVLAFTAPEVFCSSFVHFGSDVYGFGVMLWEIASLEQSFEGFDRSTHFQKVVRSSQRPVEVDESWNKAIAEIVNSCCHPHKRPSMKRVQAALETALLFQEPGKEIQLPACKQKKLSSSTATLSSCHSAACSEEEEKPQSLRTKEIHQNYLLSRIVWRSKNC